MEPVRVEHVDGVQRLTWAQAEALARALPEKHNLIVPKRNLADPAPYARSWMGRRRGALRQFRDNRRHRSLHVKEYSDCWILHVDAWNPHKSLFRHLLVDHGYSVFLSLGHALDAVQPDAVPSAE